MNTWRYSLKPILNKHFNPFFCKLTLVTWKPGDKFCSLDIKTAILNSISGGVLQLTVAKKTNINKPVNIIQNTHKLKDNQSEIKHAVATIIHSTGLDWFHLGSHVCKETENRPIHIQKTDRQNIPNSQNWAGRSCFTLSPGWEWKDIVIAWEGNNVCL